MATSYSTNLALALPATGELSGTWGTTVNSNITNMLDEALGYQAYSATGGSDTLTIPDGTTGVARSIYIQLNGTGGGSVAVPTTKTKMYFVFNNTSSAITFKVTGQTGVSIPAAAKIALVSNGTDIIVAQNYFSALTLGAALPVASGGTSLTTLTANNVILGNGTSAPTFVAPSTNGNVLTSNGTTWVSSAGASVSAATPTALGTVYGSMTTSGASPYLTALGYNAAVATTAPRNTAVGFEALKTNTSGDGSTAVGYQSLVLSTGDQNTAVGRSTLAANVGGSYNTAMGWSALAGNNTGTGNTAIGYYTLKSNTSGTYNVALGYRALDQNSTGSTNIGIGFNALTANTVTDNTGIGTFAATANTTGTDITAIGNRALVANTTGAQNTAIGSNAGGNLTTGSNNILIGYNNTASSASVSNENTFGNSSSTSNRFWGDMKMGGSAAGSSGQVLTSAGAGVTPTWATPSASALVYISQVVASSSTTVDIENAFTAYQQYIIIGSEITTTSDFNIRFKIGGSYLTANYYHFGLGGYNGVVTAYLQQGDNVSEIFAYGNGFATVANFYLTIGVKSGKKTFVNFSVNGDTSSKVGIQNGAGMNSSTSALEGIRIFGSTYTGTFRLYGIANS